MALKIGLTGGIGSGKTTVAEIYKVLGIPVFNADETAKELMETNPELQYAIKEQFGESCYLDGKLNKKLLAAIVFNDPYQLEKLNSLVHPHTIAAADIWAAKQTTPYTVKEAALFFEAGTAIGFDYMIGVSAPKNLRVQRVIARDGQTRDEVELRMKRQISDEIKMRLCDFVILNDDLHLLVPQILKLHKRFLEESTKTD